MERLAAAFARDHGVTVHETPVFDVSWPSEPAWTSEEVVPEEVFYFFDEPLLFSVVFGPLKLLLQKFSASDGLHLYTESLVDDRTLAALRESRVSVFGAVAADLRFVIQLDDMVPVRVWKCSSSNLDLSSPVPGIALDRHAGIVPHFLDSGDASMRRVRHLVRGTEYDVSFERVSVQAAAPIHEGDEIAVYVGDDGKPWARPVAEFNDGRFEDVRPRPAPAADRS